MKLPPSVIIHSLAHARMALAAGRPVTLLSAPGAGVYAGVGWWRAVIEAAVAGVMDEVPPDILDCGEAAGRALEALRGGQLLLVLRTDPAVFSDLAGRAAACGGALLACPPPALDLALPDASRRLAAWLNPGG